MTNMISPKIELNYSEKQVQTKSQNNFARRILPREYKRILFFNKNKPKITFTTQFRALDTHDDIISQSEIVLMKRDYEFLHTEPNDMINPNPPIKKSLKVHRRNKRNEETKVKSPVSSEVISYIETNPFYIHRIPNQNKASNTLYTVLTQKKQQFFAQLSQIKEKRPILPQLTDDAQKREQCIKVNQPNTNYSDMNKRDAIPVVNPITCINDASYSNISERERYQKLSEELLKEKELVNRKPDYWHFILKEFLLRNGIYENQYYQKESLENLNEYLNSDIVIKPNRTLREHIIEGLNYIDYKTKAKNKDKDKEDIDNDNDKNNEIDGEIVRKSAPIRKIVKKKHQGNDNNQQCSNIKTDMELQRNLYDNKLLQTQIDFAKSPKLIVDLLKDDFNDGEYNQQHNPLQSKASSRIKTESNFYHSNPSRERLYANKTTRNDFNIIKKNNKILEYICYEKAKKIIQFKELKNKLMIEDLKTHSPIRKKK